MTHYYYLLLPWKTERRAVPAFTSLLSPQLVVVYGWSVCVPNMMKYSLSAAAGAAARRLMFLSIFIMSMANYFPQPAIAFLPPTPALSGGAPLNSQVIMRCIVSRRVCELRGGMLWCNFRLDRQYNALRCVCFIGCRTAPPLNSSYSTNNIAGSGAPRKNTKGLLYYPTVPCCPGPCCEGLHMLKKHGDGLRVAFNFTSCT